MEFTPEDVKDLSDCGWYEARGEPEGGMELVMWCVRNRVGASGFPKTLHGVVYQKGAFSWTDPANPEHNEKPVPEHSDYNKYVLAIQLAQQVLAAAQEADRSLGARYYANLRTMDKDGWFARIVSGIDGAGTLNHPLLLVHGAHHFYR